MKVDARISAFWNLCLASVSIYTKNWKTAYGKSTQSKHFGGDKWYVIVICNNEALSLKNEVEPSTIKM